MAEGFSSGPMAASIIVMGTELISYAFEALQRCVKYIRDIPGLLKKKPAEMYSSVLLWCLGTFCSSGTLCDALLSVGLVRSFALQALEARYTEACENAFRVPR